MRVQKQKSHWNFLAVALVGSSLVIGVSEVHASDHRAPGQCENILASDTTPETAILDRRYGQLSLGYPDLLEPALINAGFRNPSAWSLCGAVVLINAMAKVRMAFQRVSPFTSAAEELTFMAKHLVSAEKFEGWMKSGVSLTDFQETMAKMLGREGLEADINLFVMDWPNEISMRENSVIVYLTQRYNTMDAELIGSKTYAYSHYMIFAGYDRVNPNRLYFSDPNNPSVLRAAVRDVLYPTPETPTPFLAFKDTPSDHIILTYRGVRIENIRKKVPSP